MKNKIAIIGIVGLPGNYGGFETLVENLMRNFIGFKNHEFTVYCSSISCTNKLKNFYSAKLKYIPIRANGIQSILYDIVCIIHAIFSGNKTLLILGTSGAIIIPLINFFSHVRIITNIDGMEWHRKKWGFFTKFYIKISEFLAIKFSDDVISDNSAISEYILDTYNVKSTLIGYGGDHTTSVEFKSVDELNLPIVYSFTVCRIEPENNIHMILKAFSSLKTLNLVIVGNWKSSKYGLKLIDEYSSFKNIFLLDPIYDLGKLRSLRENATSYIHGHSAGGTNPSLVEAMHFGKLIFAYDCVFNRVTTENNAVFFNNSSDLINLLENTSNTNQNITSAMSIEIALRRYTWREISRQYQLLLGI